MVAQLPTTISNSNGLFIQDAPWGPNEPVPFISTGAGSEDLFRTLRIPVVRGREFTEADNENPMAGFVVNETFARRYLAGRDPLTVSLSVQMQNDDPYLPIIGVVGDVSEGSVRVAAQPTVFYDHARMPWATMTLFLRGRKPESLVKPVTAALHELVARIESEAARLGARVAGSELVGLMPAGAAAAAAGAQLRIDGFDASRVLELRLLVGNRAQTLTAL